MYTLYEVASVHALQLSTVEVGRFVEPLAGALPGEVGHTGGSSVADVVKLHIAEGGASPAVFFAVTLQ
jgi:hypothetical protein